PPGLAHLRESGALEQDADVVIMLHRPKAAGEDEEEGEESWKNSSQGEQVQVIVAKHRNGPTGTVEMLFVKQYTSFHDLTQNWAGGEAAPMPEEAPPEPEGLPPMDSDIF
ncbi:MAG: replicative DNA helicase, partial [Firmicutes bacterium]|nr:replicative DNA helicase [Bacillota bacterium]